jgi:hypothetical protein
MSDNPAMERRMKGMSSLTVKEKADVLTGTLQAAEVALIAADVAVGGPTGEGIVPAVGVKAVREGIEAAVGVGKKGGPSPSGGKPSTLEPGPNAGESIPARGPGRDFTSGERSDINRIGGESGCHTCGSTDPGTKSDNFVPDHQPPSALNDGGSQKLFPQCKNCSNRQGGQVSAEKRRIEREDQ